MFTPTDEGCQVETDLKQLVGAQTAEFKVRSRLILRVIIGLARDLLENAVFVSRNFSIPHPGWRVV
jgi:hypothetical protein